MEASWEFLDSYKSHLIPHEQEEAYHFNKLQLNFFSGESHLLLLKRRFGIYSDPHYEIDFRLLSLMARYEMGDLYGIETSMKSVWQYIHTQSDKKVLPSRKKGAFEYLKLFRLLLRARDREDWETLKENILQVSKEAKQGWFLQQVEAHL